MGKLGIRADRLSFKERQTTISLGQSWPWNISLGLVHTTKCLETQKPGTDVNSHYH